MKVLIFRSNTLEALLKAREFKSWGYTTIGASSVNSEYNVTKDINNFAKEVISGGWIIFDDYNWKYGNGVKEASDRYLEENIKIIKQAFYSGGALFVNLK